MPRPPLPFRLKAPDTKVLEALVHCGVQPVRVVVRALALLALHRGDSAPGVAVAVRLSPQADPSNHAESHHMTRFSTSALLLAILAMTASGQARPVRYDVDRTPFVEVGGDGTRGDPILTTVFGATKTANGFVVAESRSSSLLFLDAKGKVVRTVGRQGQGPGEFNGGIFVSRCAGDSIFAWDSRTMRISVFTASGVYARQIPAFAARFACSRANVIALLLRPRDIPGRSGGAVERISPVTLIDLKGDSLGGVAAVPATANQMFGPAPSIAVRGEELYVGTGRQPSIDVYDRRGRPLRRITFPSRPVPISTAAFEGAVEELLDAGRLVGEQRAQQRAALLKRGFPPEYPPYRLIAVAPNGMVWLLTSQMRDSVAHLRAVSDNGNVVAEVDLPGENAWLLEAGDDYLLLSYVNAEGDMRVGAFRVRRRAG